MMMMKTVIMVIIKIIAHYWQGTCEISKHITAKVSPGTVAPPKLVRANTYGGS